MPTYDYICKDCNHEWEEESSIKAPPTKICPKCEKPFAKRLISKGTSFILEGAGWASDNYSKK